MPRTDGVDEPVLVPGNPVKLSKMTEGPETRVPWVGEHTSALLESELGLGAGRYDDERWLQMLADEPLLLCMPLTRWQHKVTIGLTETEWKQWIELDKK